VRYRMKSCSAQVQMSGSRQVEVSAPWRPALACPHGVLSQATAAATASAGPAVGGPVPVPIQRDQQVKSTTIREREAPVGARHAEGRCAEAPGVWTADEGDRDRLPGRARGAKRLEAILSEVIRAAVAAPDALQPSAEVRARIMIAAAHGFKTVAHDTQEMRAFLHDLVRMTVAGLPVDGEVTRVPRQPGRRKTTGRKPRTS